MDILENLLSYDAIMGLLNSEFEGRKKYNFTAISDCINNHCVIGGTKYNVSYQTISQISNGVNRNMSLPSLIALTWFFDSELRKISNAFKTSKENQVQK